MQVESSSARSNKEVWVGRALTALVVLFLIMDGIMKLVDPGMVQETQKQLGYPPMLDRPLGILILVIVILYALPATSVSGAVLLTGYLGGAVAAHLRVGDPVFTHVLFGVYVGVLAWGGLWLRDPRVRALVLLKRR